MARDLILGRMRFPTVFDGIDEMVGESLEQVGAAVGPSDRSARAFKLKVPVYASNDEPLPTVRGDRLRRQLRGLLDNAPARLGGTYMAMAFDSEQNGWLMIGKGQLGYGDGGVTFSDYQLELEDVYRVGLPRTHREARRLERYSRLSATVQRDYLGLYSSATDWSAYTPLYLHWLPYGATSILSQSRVAVSTVYTVRRQVPNAERFVSGGNANWETDPFYSGRAHGEVLSFDRPDDKWLGTNDVVVQVGSLVATPLLPLQTFEDGLGVGQWVGTPQGPIGLTSTLANSSVQAQTGTYSLAVTTPGGANTQGASVPIGTAKKGVPQTASAWVRVPVTQNMSVSLEDNYATNGNGLATRTVSVTANTWTRMTVTWTPTADSAAARLYIYASSGSAAMTFFIDMAEVTALTSADVANLILNPQGWEGTTGMSAEAGTTLGNSQTAFTNENGEVSARAFTILNAALANGGFAGFYTSAAGTSGFPVAALAAYYARCTFVDLPALLVTPQIVVTWYAATGGTVSTSTIAGTASAAGTSPLVLKGSVTAPAGAVYAAVSYRIVNSSGGTINTGTVRVTRLAFAPGPQCLVEFPDVGAPSYEWVGDGLSSSTVDGEEAYGPNHPMPFPPVISNGICRIAWDSFEDGLRYAFANRPPGQTNNVVLRDQGVFTFHSSTSDLESGNFKLESLRSWDVLEWTPERAVVRYTVFSTNVNSVYGETTDVYVTLQRGWTGPRIEAYTPNAQDDGNVGIAFGAQPSPNNPGHVSAFCGTTGGTGQHMSMSLASTGGVNWPLMTTVDARFRAAFSPMSINDPAFACIPDDPSRAVVTMCPVRGTHIAYQFFSGTSEGGRKGIALGQPSSPNAGYVGCQVGATPNWAGSSVHGYAVEAESVMNPAGTRTSVADAAGTGGNAVNDTQTSNAANTVVQTIAAANPAQSVRVSLWVRGRVTTGGDTGSFAATGFPTTATTTSTTYVWLYLGEAVVSTSAAFNIAIQAWRSAGAGTTGIRVDRYVAIPVSRTDLTGVRDHGQASLADCRQVPELVAR